MTLTDAYRDLLRTIAETDYETASLAAGHDDLACTPYMPFPLYDFIALAAESLPDSTGDTFLEIGCGPGTRMLAAQALFDFHVTGIERVAEYARRGRALDLEIVTADALGWGGYGDYDVLFFNRVFRDRETERKLEREIWDAMKPGATVICANLEFPPPADWLLILDDWEIRRGIWRKP